MRVEQWRGREADHHYRLDEKMCVNLDLVREGQAVNARIKETVCQICPHNEGCAYLAQFNKEADIWVGSHENLFLPMNYGPFAGADLVIIDEGFTTKGLIGTETPVQVSLDSLMIPPPVKNNAKLADIWAELEPLRRILSDVLREHPEAPIERQRLVDAGLTADMAKAAGSLEWKAKEEIRVKTGTTIKGLRKMFSEAKHNKTVSRMAMAWRTIEEQISGDIELNGRAQIDHVEDEKSGLEYMALRLFGL